MDNLQNDYIFFHLLRRDNSMGTNAVKKGNLMMLRKDKIEAIEVVSDEECRVIFDVKDPQYGFYKACPVEIEEQLGIK